MGLSNNVIYSLQQNETGFIWWAQAMVFSDLMGVSLYLFPQSNTPGRTFCPMRRSPDVVHQRREVIVGVW
jgi:hypothetical protein